MGGLALRVTRQRPPPRHPLPRGNHRETGELAAATATCPLDAYGVPESGLCPGSMLTTLQTGMTLPPPPFYRFRPHPWHGLDVGVDAPRIVNAYIELTPFDTMKYEIDKSTGYLIVDRPQRSSALSPTLYGFIPRTFCAARVAALSPEANAGGDGDPLDICVFSERHIERAEVVLRARIVGGIQMVDDGEADDKIVAVLHNDPFFDATEDLSELPRTMVERLIHYFSTYKLMPGTNHKVSVTSTYGRSHAWQVVEAAVHDYAESYDLAPPSLQF